MATWPKDELLRMIEADDLRVSPFREDGVTYGTPFSPVEGALNDRIDDAYREKYRGSSYLDPMLSDRARSATLRVVPSLGGQGN